MGREGMVSSFSATPTAMDVVKSPALKEFEPLDPTLAQKSGARRGKRRSVTSTPVTSFLGSGKSAVIYVGRIPHGFYEDQMRGFFSQFGDIKRLRLSRNKKTGKSKHYAFIEFESPEVAPIVAEAMHNYLLFESMLQVKVVPPEKINRSLWIGANRVFKTIEWQKLERERHNKVRTPKEQARLLGELVKKDQKRRKKLQEAGIDYDYPEIVLQVAQCYDGTTFKESDEVFARKPSFHVHLRRSSLMMMRIPRLQHCFGRKSRRVYSRRAVKDPRRIRFKKSVSSMIMRNLRLLLSFAGVHSLIQMEDPWKKLRENSTRVFGMETSLRKLKMSRMGHKISRAIEDSRLFSKPMAHKFLEKCVTTKFKMFPAPDQCIYIPFALLYQRFSCTLFTCAD